MDTLFSILHVATAVFIIGPLAITPMTSLRSIRAGDTSRAAASGASVRLLSYLSLIVAITGFGVMGMADPKYGLTVATPWVLASLIFYAVALVITLVIVVPALRGSERLSARAGYARVAAGSGVATVCLVFVVVLMVWKP